MFLINLNCDVRIVVYLRNVLSCLVQHGTFCFLQFFFIGRQLQVIVILLAALPPSLDQHIEVISLGIKNQGESLV